MITYAYAYAQRTTHRRSIFPHDQPTTQSEHNRQPGVSFAETSDAPAERSLFRGSSSVAIGKISIFSSTTTLTTVVEPIQCYYGVSHL